VTPIRRRFLRILIELVVALASLVSSCWLFVAIAFSGFDRAVPHPTATLLLTTSIGTCVMATAMLVVELVLAVIAAVSRLRRKPSAPAT
jgi:putative copper export protein